MTRRRLDLEKAVDQPDHARAVEAGAIDVAEARRWQQAKAAGQRRRRQDGPAKITAFTIASAVAGVPDSPARPSGAAALEAGHDDPHHRHREIGIVEIDDHDLPQPRLGQPREPSR